MLLRQHERAIRFALIVFLPASAEVAGDTAPTVVGGDHVVWIFREVTDADASADEANADSTAGKRPLRFAVEHLDATSPRFRLVPLDPLRGVVAHAVVRGEYLHLFFADGDHYRINPPVTGADTRNDYPELKLPENAVPLAVAGDDDADVLCAVVPSRLAQAIVARQSADEQAASTKEPPTTQPTSESQATTRPAVTSAPAEPVSTRYCLVRYNGRLWRLTAAIPEFFDHHDACVIAAWGGQCHLLYTEHGAAKNWMYARFDGKTWDSPRLVSGIRGDLEAFVAWEKGAALVTSESEGSHHDRALSVLRLDPDAELSSAALTDAADKDLLMPKGAFTVSRAADQIAVAWRNDQNQIMFGAWPMTGGKPVVAPSEVRLLRDVPRSSMNENFRLMLGASMLVLLLAAVFLRRRESFLIDCPMPPGYELATTGRRFVAFLLDLIIVSSLAYPILAEWFTNHFDFSDDPIAQIDLLITIYVQEFFWRWLLAVLVYIIYGAVFEAFAAATPGKMIMRLQVFNDRGTRCSIPAVLLRNLLRIVELYPMLQFAPTVIFVLMTRNHQRIGDLLARTVVCQKKDVDQGLPAKTRPVDHPESTDGDNGA